MTKEEDARPPAAPITKRLRLQNIIVNYQIDDDEDQIEDCLGESPDLDQDPENWVFINYHIYRNYVIVDESGHAVEEVNIPMISRDASIFSTWLDFGHLCEKDKTSDEYINDHNEHFKQDLEEELAKAIAEGECKPGDRVDLVVYMIDDANH